MSRAKLSAARAPGRAGLKGVERHSSGWCATPEFAYTMRIVYLAARPPGGV